MIYIDKYAYISALKNTKPELKLLFGTMSLISIICTSSITACIFGFAVISLIIVYAAKIPAAYYLKLMLIPLSFLILSVFGVIAEISDKMIEDNIFYLQTGPFYVTITNDGVLLAISLICKSLAAVSCMYFIILTTPVRDMVIVMRKLKCPKTILSLIIMTYRFIFIIMDIAVCKVKSQQCRHGYEHSKGFAKTFGMLWSSVFIQSFMACEWVYKAMLIRGYDGDIQFLSNDTALDIKETLAACSFAAVITIIGFVY